MANQYGVANPLALPAVYGTPAAGDVNCPSGAETTVITTGVITSGFAGSIYPLILPWLTIVLGAAAPSALVIAARIGAGADFDTFTVEPALLANLAELTFGVPMIGGNSASIWWPTGSALNITVKPTGQAVTCKGVGSRAIVALFRGPD